MQQSVTNSLVFRYGLAVAGLGGLFSGFVACGSQLYKVSLHEDTDTPSSATAGMASGAEGAADPQSNMFGLHAPGGWDRIPMHFSVDPGISTAQLRQLLAAMKTWEMAVGRSLFAYDGTTGNATGDSFKDLYSSLADSVNGHYLDANWAKTGKPVQVLATTIWNNDPADATKIITADIRYNNNYYVFGDSLVIKGVGSREVVDLQTLATHELGHWLGLAHISPSVDSQSIMVPSLYIGEGLSNRHVSRGDLQRIQKIYSCTGSSCDLDKTLAAIDKFVTAQQLAAPKSPPGANIKQPLSSAPVGTAVGSSAATVTAH